MSGKITIYECSIINALTYQSCCQHFKKALCGGKLWFGHAVMAMLEFPPFIGQLVAITAVVFARLSAYFKGHHVDSNALWGRLEKLTNENSVTSLSSYRV